MTLRERLDAELKTAMKAKDVVGLSVIRMIRSVAKNREIDQKKPLDDAGIAEVVTTLVKQRRESIRMFREAGRDDLVVKEEKELALLLDFLPRQLTDEEVSQLVTEAVSATGASGLKDLGMLMKVLKPQVAGRADGSLVSRIVKENLS
jgi:uncharacterized protein YqeY